MYIVVYFFFILDEYADQLIKVSYLGGCLYLSEVLLKLHDPLQHGLVDILLPK